MGQFGIIQFKLIMALFQDKTNLQTEQMIAEAQKPKQTIKPPTALIKEERENTHFSYVSKNMTLQVSNERIFQTKFSPDTSMLASSTEDGLIKVSCATTGMPLYSITADTEGGKRGDTVLPVTSLAWRSSFSDNQFD